MEPYLVGAGMKASVYLPDLSKLKRRNLRSFPELGKCLWHPAVVFERASPLGCFSLSIFSLLVVEASGKDKRKHGECRAHYRETTSVCYFWNYNFLTSALIQGRKRDSFLFPLPPQKEVVPTTALRNNTASALQMTVFYNLTSNFIPLSFNFCL